MSGRPDVGERLRHVKLVVTDVDGVLTDGSLVYGDRGETIKVFSARDGTGLKLLREAGIHVAIVSGRSSAPLRRRASDLGIEHLVMGCADKWAAVRQLAADLDVALDDTLFVGDDLIDLPVFGRVGVSVAVADAHDDVRRVADWVTAAGGGRGAVREVTDAVLAARADHEPCSFRVVIPARYGSTRLPGKPLRAIAGRPMIAHAWDRAVESGADEIWVATDDQRIVAAVEAFGGRALLTSPGCVSGTDRLAEVAERFGWPDDSIVVNLQGDEPLMPPTLLSRVARELRDRPDVGIATAASPISEPADVFDPNVVKVVVDDARRAAYFSRAPIPWVRGAFDADARMASALPADCPFLRHLGLYAYRAAVVRRLAAAAPSALERAESLEQLRALALGIAVAVAVTDAAPGHGVDTERDLERVERALADA